MYIDYVQDKDLGISRNLGVHRITLPLDRRTLCSNSNGINNNLEDVDLRNLVGSEEESGLVRLLEKSTKHYLETRAPHQKGNAHGRVQWTSNNNSSIHNNNNNHNRITSTLFTPNNNITHNKAASQVEGLHRHHSLFRLRWGCWGGLGV